MTSLELARVESRIPRKAEINDLGVLANHLAHSGMFKDAKGGAQAFAKLLFGRDLGLSATAAMTGVHIIEGKPEIGANLQAQMVKTYIGPEGERYDYKVLAHTAAECSIEFTRRRDGEWSTLGASTYTMEDAKLAELAGRGPWKKHPRNMLFARAMSDGVAFHCPEVTNGIRTYHEGEIDVDGSVRAAQAQAPAAEDVVLEEIVDGEIVEPANGNGNGPEPERASLSPELVDELVAAKKTAGLPNERVREHLIGIGVEDVPAGNVSLKTIRALSEQQASDLLDVFTEAIETKGADDEPA
jgi:hypothetical protein